MKTIQHPLISFKPKGTKARDGRDEVIVQFYGVMMEEKNGKIRIYIPTIDKTIEVKKD